MGLLTYDAIYKLNKRPDEPPKEPVNDDVTILDKELAEAYAKINQLKRDIT